MFLYSWEQPYLTVNDVVSSGSNSVVGWDRFYVTDTGKELNIQYNAYETYQSVEAMKQCDQALKTAQSAAALVGGVSSRFTSI